MALTTLEQAAKDTLWLTTDAYDGDVQRLVRAAQLDLGVAGVDIPDEIDALVTVAVCTYVRMLFGSPADFDRLKKSYDEQKAQLATCTGYTDWGDSDD